MSRIIAIAKFIASEFGPLAAFWILMLMFGVKVAIENHAGDMHSWELQDLIEEAGVDYVGANIDSGNAAWTLEDPHATLEALHPYVLTSHVRDSAVWSVPEGLAVSWVRMGEGNVNIDEYCRKYAALCPGRALSMETIVMGPRVFPFRWWGVPRPCLEVVRSNSEPKKQVRSSAILP